MPGVIQTVLLFFAVVPGRSLEMVCGNLESVGHEWFSEGEEHSFNMKTQGRKPLESGAPQLNWLASIVRCRNGEWSVKRSDGRAKLSDRDHSPTESQSSSGHT